MDRSNAIKLISSFCELAKEHGWRDRLLVSPWRYSDPLVSPYLDEIFSLSHEMNFDVAITTNGVSYG